MKSTRFDSLSFWGVYQPDRRIDFNGYLWTRSDGNVLIDPMELSAGQASYLDDRGGASAILLTGWDHVRASAELKERYGSKVYAPAEDRPRFGDAAQLVDGWYDDAEGLGHGLDRDVQVYNLRGGKAPVETALYLKPLQALYFGDLVRSHATGKLMLLPEAKLTDRAEVIAGVKPLAEVALRAVLLGDGDPIFTGAEETFHAFCAEL